MVLRTEKIIKLKILTLYFEEQILMVFHYM